MKKPNEHLRVNFGKQPFVFDMDRMMQQERDAIMAEIRKTDVSSLHPPDDEETLIHKLVGQYLAHEGYIDTAKAFARDVHEKQQSTSSNPQPFQLPESDDDIHAINRQKIRRSILDGDIDRALKYTSSYYPHVLEEERNKDIYFQLKCRKFIEMMRKYTELVNATASPEVATKSVDSLSSNGHAETGEEGEGDEEAEEDEGQDTQMELDDQLHREASNGHKSPTHQPQQEHQQSSNDDVDMMTTSQESASWADKSSFMKKDDLLSAALAYGQELQHEFGSDPRPEIKKQLQDLFAIIAYPNPADSPIGSLLEKEGRAKLAEGVNGAILGECTLATSPTTQYLESMNGDADMFRASSKPRQARLRRARENLRPNGSSPRRVGGEDRRSGYDGVGERLLEALSSALLSRYRCRNLKGWYHTASLRST
jgi:Ran-binding protein 9/10